MRQKDLKFKVNPGNLVRSCVCVKEGVKERGRGAGVEREKRERERNYSLVIAGSSSISMPLVSTLNTPQSK